MSSPTSRPVAWSTTPPTPRPWPGASPRGPIALYYGCDPTADSLHVGNLIGLLVLRRFLAAGHHPIALAGGATGMIGDPSGQSEERNLLDDDTLDANLAAIKDQITQVLAADEGWTLVDNRDWTGDLRLLEFLRDVGKHVTVNQMVAKESVQDPAATARPASPTPSSPTCCSRPTTTCGCTSTTGASSRSAAPTSGATSPRAST